MFKSRCNKTQMHFPISRSRTRKSILNYEGIVYFNFNFSSMCNVVIFLVQYMKNAVITSTCIMYVALGTATARNSSDSLSI